MNTGNRGTRWLWAAAAAACVAAGAAGQVQQVQNGQALDANPAVGRMGYNTPIAGNSPVNSQLYVTGQVSGLSAFAGRTGYVAPGQLDLVLPSAAMDDFTRQSGGLTDAGRNRPYATQAYYDPAKTTMYLSRALEYQQSGMNLPAVATSVPPAISQQLYVDAMAKYGAIGAGAEARLAPMPRTEMPLGGKLAATGEALSMQPVAYDVAAGPSFSGLFAIPRGAEQLSLQRELYAVAHRGEAVNSRLRAEVGPSGDAAADSLAALAGTGGAEAWGAGTTGKDGAGQTRGGALGTPAGQGPLNQDVFLEMLMKMRQVREQKPAAGPSSAPAQPDGTAPGLAVGMAPGTALTATGGPRTLVEIGKDRALVIHGLAGQSKDLFNLNMARAGAEMKSRRYYDAANTYETAGLVDPRNPLAHVGMGLSLLGAGESLSAAYQLSQAVSLFPPLMETRIDLPGMVDQKVIDAHLDRLDARIAAADPESKRMLQFLAAFLYRNSNRPDQAKTYAEQLLTTSKNNAVLRAYADLILTGKTPGEKEGGIGKLGVEPATPKLLPLPGGVILPTTRPAKPATLPSVTPRVGNTPDKGAKADKKGAGPAK